MTRTYENALYALSDLCMFVTFVIVTITFFVNVITVVVATGQYVPIIIPCRA